MSLFNDASLVLTPNGVKSGKVYSIKPTDGVGDFDFTRASSATRVNSDGLIETVSTGFPRLNYPPLGGCPSLLLEPQRTNLVTYSEEFDNADWSKINTPTITTNIATAPDGYSGADGIQDTTGGTFRRIRQTFSVTANGTHTASVFVKKETTQTNFGGLALFFTGVSTTFAYGIVDPINGTIVVASDSIIASSSTKVEDYGTYWRFSLTATDNQSNTSLRIEYYATLSTNGTSTAPGVGSVRTIWGAQLEVGSSPTSYIPTVASTVTRVAEVCNGAGNSQVFNGSEGVLFVEMSALANDSTSRRINLRNSSGSNQVRIQYGIVPNEIVGVLFNGANQAIISDTSNNILNFNKIAFKYKENDFALWINGVEVGTDISGTTIGAGILDRIDLSLSGTETYSNIKQIQYFDTALTDQELEQLTSL
jgi:hypothetical protein